MGIKLLIHLLLLSVQSNGIGFDVLMHSRTTKTAVAVS